MPYIRKGIRKVLDPPIDELNETLCIPTSGEIAYVIFRIVDKFYGNANFAGLAEGIGVLDCVKEEFRRRRLNPYEDKKMKENGDVLKKKGKIVVYIACPYTLGDAAVNVHNAIKVADQVAVAGFIPYVPIWSHFWHLITPHPYEFWMELGMEYLSRCDCVLRVEGESKGADAEVTQATLLGIPVFRSIQAIVAYYKGS